MRDVERLLERAREIMGSFQLGLFPDDDDGFMEALGVDKSKYEVKHQDGTVGYDFLAALNDLAAVEWNEVEEPRRTSARQSTVSGEDVQQTAALDKAEPEEILPKSKTKTEEIPQQSKKMHRLFGWG